MTTHYLKTWPAYYDSVASGEKTFEIRQNDRGFQVGDVVVLQRTLPEELCTIEVDENGLPAFQMAFEIGYVFHGGIFGLMAGFCAFSLIPLKAVRV